MTAESTRPAKANRPAVVATLLTGTATAIAVAAVLAPSRSATAPAAVGLALLAGFATSGSV